MATPGIRCRPYTKSIKRSSRNLGQAVDMVLGLARTGAGRASLRRQIAASWTEGAAVDPAAQATRDGGGRGLRPGASGTSAN
jgi:hypothetical protein